jgi:S-formylglutathione hydrolase
MSLELLGKHECFGGEQRFYAHQSLELGCRMRFSLYLPPAASRGPVAGLTYLSGLTCTEETFAIKAGAQRMASELGLALLAPDTSPRGLGLSGDNDDWDFGSGAGFYLDATQEPWSDHYRMYSYVIGELRELIMSEFPFDPGRQGIFGHSMGGHGALTIGLKHPELYRSISAFAPICAPSLCPWGQKAFSNYLGDDRSRWDAYDASVIAANLLEWPTSFSRSNCSRRAWKRPADSQDWAWICVSTRATTTATISFPASWRTTCVTTPGFLVSRNDCLRSDDVRAAGWPGLSVC